ncbi:hypothetical protein DSM106972_091460 [Dulcicalothrix desertica PCC 7102]|uniref:ABC transporter domain-containing protein n=1 Tax=Dulcicalothrix desertica PCC 7102 TaxID=232991 RepID=A0A433UMC5_9CYAN|nr:hypothetical protein DSM106972_091460 [Dulcicalothrix desertica PCC 7102]
MASVDRVMDLLDTPIQINTGDIHLDVDKARGEIEFKNVSFSYQTEYQPIIKNLSLHIGSGKTIAIVGSTGSGKSTLVKLLLRFYDVTDGTITIDGINI